MCTPQDDIDCYCNLNWKKNNQGFSNFSLIQKKINLKLLDYIHNVDSNDIMNLKMKFFLNSYEHRFNHTDILFLYVKKILSCDNFNCLGKILCTMKSFFVKILFNSTISTYYHDGLKYVYDIDGPSLVFDELEKYYNPKNIMKIEKIAKQIMNFLDYSCNNFVQDVIVIEMILAETIMNVKDKHDNMIIYNPISYCDFLKKYDRNNFFQSYLNIPINTKINMTNVNLINIVSKIICNDDTFRMLKNYTLFSFIFQLSPYIKNLKNINKKIKQKKLNIFINCFGSYLEELYEKEHTNLCYGQITKMYETIIEQYKKFFTNTNKLTIKTKNACLKKLDSLQLILGSQKSLGYEKFPDLTNNFFTNLFLINEYHYNKSISMLNRPIINNMIDVNNNIFSFEVNAYCDSMIGKIFIPTSLINTIFYSCDSKDQWYNYGSMGCIIAHEIMHVFDDYDDCFDNLGRLGPWWDLNDKFLLQSEMDKINNHYNLVGLNETSSLSENISDIVGIMISLRSYIDNYCYDITYNQKKEHIRKFFERWAITMRGQKKINNDPHSPNHMRINVPLSHIKEYYEVFNVLPIHKNYLSPEKRFTFFN